MLSKHPDIAKLFDGVAKYECLTLFPGEVLVSQEVRLESVYVLLTGSLIVEHLMANGMLLHIDLVEPYDFMGDLEQLTQTITIHQVRAKETCELLQFNLEEYERLMRDAPLFSLAVAKSLAHKLRGTTDNFLNYVRLPLKYRLYLEFDKALAVSETEGQIPYDSDRYAEKLGVTSRSVNRLVKELKDKQYIQLRENRTLIFTEIGHRFICHELTTID